LRGLDLGQKNIVGERAEPFTRDAGDEGEFGLRGPAPTAPAFAAIFVLDFRAAPMTRTSCAAYLRRSR
jgi:hypothetical protein